MGAHEFSEEEAPDRMHVDEVDIDASLVARLLAAQLPQWAHLPIARVRSAGGTDNAIYRLGAVGRVDGPAVLPTQQPSARRSGPTRD